MVTKSTRTVRLIAALVDSRRSLARQQRTSGSTKRGLRPRVEDAEPLGISRERRRQDLDRDPALQLRVARNTCLDPAFADLGGDVVNADARARSEGQSRVISLLSSLNAHMFCIVHRGARSVGATRRRFCAEPY